MTSVLTPQHNRLLRNLSHQIRNYNDWISKRSKATLALLRDNKQVVINEIALMSLGKVGEKGKKKKKKIRLKFH